VSMKLTPSSTARRNTAFASSRSAGWPQIPSPVIRMAPKPRRLTVRSPPTSIVPAIAACTDFTSDIDQTSFDCPHPSLSPRRALEPALGPKLAAGNRGRPGPAPATGPGPVGSSTAGSCRPVPPAPAAAEHARSAAGGRCAPSSRSPAESQQVRTRRFRVRCSRERGTVAEVGTADFGVANDRAWRARCPFGHRLCPSVRGWHLTDVRVGGYGGRLSTALARMVALRTWPDVVVRLLLTVKWWL
jgi:hypothetical protein